MPAIFVFVGPGLFDGEVTGFALAEDGRLIASHVFPTAEKARIRMERPTKIYREVHPDGYDVEWVDDPTTHPGCLVALRRNKEAWEADRPRREAAARAQIEATMEQRRRDRERTQEVEPEPLSPSDQTDIEQFLDQWRRPDRPSDDSEEED